MTTDAMADLDGGCIAVVWRPGSRLPATFPGRRRADGRSSVRQSSLTTAFAVAFAVMAGGLIVAVLNVQNAITREDAARSRQVEFTQLSQQLVNGADFLSMQARIYAVTGDRLYLDAYWREVTETRTQEKVIERLKAMGADDSLLHPLAVAKQSSDLLVATETRSMRLVLEANGVPENKMPSRVAAYHLTAMDEALNTQDKLSTAARIMFDANYIHQKENFTALVERFRDDLATVAAKQVEASRGVTRVSMTALLVLSILILIGMAVVLWCMHGFMGRAIVSYARSLSTRNTQDSTWALNPAGTRELHQLAVAFNDQFRQIREMAQRDALTGLYNRRIVDDRLASLLRESAERGRPLSAAMLDLDHFKHINDTLSHATGDVVLRQVAALLADAATGDAFAARLGGEEFLLVFPDTDADEAMRRCEKLRQAVATHPWQSVTGEMPVTTSIGVTTVVNGNSTPSALLSDADRNLYAAKRTGRNRVVADPS